MQIVASPRNEMENGTNVLCWWLCCQPHLGEVVSVFLTAPGLSYSAWER